MEPGEARVAPRMDAANRAREMLENGVLFETEASPIPMEDAHRLLLLLGAPREDRDDREANAERGERLAAFLDELVAFVRAREHEPSGRTVAEKTLASFADGALSGEPNALSALETADLFAFGIRAAASALTRKYIGPALDAEVVSRLWWQTTNAGGLSRAVIDALPPAQRPDALDLVASAAVRALWLRWSVPVAEAAESFLNGIAADPSVPPFLRASAEANRAQIADARKNRRRIAETEASRREHRSLAARLVPEGLWALDGHLSRIARDAVAIVGQDGGVRGLARLNASELTSPQKRPSAADAARLLLQADAFAERGHAGIRELIEQVRTRVFDEASRDGINRLRGAVPPDLADAWATWERAREQTDEIVAHWRAHVVGVRERAVRAGRSPAEADAALERDRAKFDARFLEPDRETTAACRTLGRSPAFLRNVRALLSELASPPDAVPVRFGSIEDALANGRLVPPGTARDADAASLLRAAHRPAVREAVEARTGAPLADLTLREQIQLLAYLTRATGRDADRALAAIRAFGLPAARAFLACEFGLGAGDAIVRLAEGPDARAARAVFERYGILADAALGHADALIAKTLAPDATKLVRRDQLADELLRRAHGVLTRAAERPPEETVAALSRAEADTALFGAVFKSAFKGRRSVPWESVRGLSIESLRPNELAPADISRMRAMFEENWTDQPRTARRAFSVALDAALAPSSPATFRILRRDGKIVAFLRVEPRPDLGEGAMYAGSFNVNPALRGSALGEAFFRETLGAEAARGPVFAHALADIPAATFYVEEGMNAVRTENIGTPDDPALVLALRWDQKQNALSRARRAPKESILRGEIEGVRAAAFRIPEETDRLLDALAAARAGEVMSRYWIDEKDPGVRHVAFEKA